MKWEANGEMWRHDGRLAVSEKVTYMIILEKL